MGFVRARAAARPLDKALAGKEQTIDDLKYANTSREIYMDSDTKGGAAVDSPSEVAEDWFHRRSRCSRPASRSTRKLVRGG